MIINTAGKKMIRMKQQTENEMKQGAYDKNGDWWDKRDIETFTGGVIMLCFGMSKEEIKIIEKK
jgi:hypothetical protein